jgi:hypothetical protein
MISIIIEEIFCGSNIEILAIGQKRLGKRVLSLSEVFYAVTSLYMYFFDVFENMLELIGYILSGF